MLCCFFFVKAFAIHLHFGIVLHLAEQSVPARLSGIDGFCASLLLQRLSEEESIN